MAKEATEKPAGKKPAKKHLHSVRMEILRDREGKPTGKVLHHETHFVGHPREGHVEPERPVNAHNGPEEAGGATQERLAAAMGAGMPGEEQPEEAGAVGVEPGGATPSPMA